MILNGFRSLFEEFYPLFSYKQKKMKKTNYILTIIAVVLISCNDNLHETLVDVNNVKIIKITDDSTSTKFKVRGDNKYDALGFSFDATGEYLDKMSTILPVITLPLVCNEGEMVERFQRIKDSFVNKNRNVSSKDYISLCYKQTNKQPETPRCKRGGVRVNKLYKPWKLN